MLTIVTILHTPHLWRKIMLAGEQYILTESKTLCDELSWDVVSGGVVFTLVTKLASNRIWYPLHFLLLFLLFIFFSFPSSPPSPPLGRQVRHPLRTFALVIFVVNWRRKRGTQGNERIERKQEASPVRWEGKGGGERLLPSGKLGK